MEIVSDGTRSGFFFVAFSFSILRFFVVIFFPHRNVAKLFWNHFPLHERTINLFFVSALWLTLSCVHFFSVSGFCCLFSKIFCRFRSINSLISNRKLGQSLESFATPWKSDQLFLVSSSLTLLCLFVLLTLCFHTLFSPKIYYTIVAEFFTLTVKKHTFLFTYCPFCDAPFSTLVM